MLLMRDQQLSPKRRPQQDTAPQDQIHVAGVAQLEVSAHYAVLLCHQLLAGAKVE